MQTTGDFNIDLVNYANDNDIDLVNYANDR